MSFIQTIGYKIGRDQMVINRRYERELRRDTVYRNCMEKKLFYKQKCVLEQLYVELFDNLWIFEHAVYGTIKFFIIS